MDHARSNVNLMIKAFEKLGLIVYFSKKLDHA